MIQHDSTEKRDLKELQIPSDVTKTDHCGSKQSSEFSRSNVSFVFESEQDGKAITCGQDSVHTKADILTKSEQSLFSDIKQTDSVSKGINLKESIFSENEEISGYPSMEKCDRNDLELENIVSENKVENDNQKTIDDCQSSERVVGVLKDDCIGETGDSKVHPEGGIGAEKIDCPEVKTVKKKAKKARTPKCRVCDKEFKTIEQLRKHNKVPCKVRLTRNLTQKVLRPKRLEKVVPLQSVKKKKKQKVLPAKPKMITLINRRFTDKSLDFNKDKKGKLKTRRKSLYDYNFCITRSTGYRNANLDVLVQYDSLDEKEQHFFHLGLVGTDHLPPHYKTPKSLIKRVLKENTSCTMEKVLEKEVEEFVEDEPPVLEKVVDAAGRIQEDIYILRDEIHREIEPPVLITVEGFGKSCSLNEASYVVNPTECPTLVTEQKENNEFKYTVLPNVPDQNYEPNKENNLGSEIPSINKDLKSVSFPPPKDESKGLSEELTVADASNLKSPNKTLSERHFTDAMDVLNETFSDEPEFTKTKLKDEDNTKPSYSVTLGLQTDIPSATDKIMYPRSAFILKCLKRLENKHRNIQDDKVSVDRGNQGRKNLFESLKNVSEDTKLENTSTQSKVPSQMPNKDNEQEKRVEEIIVYPKPVDPKNLEYRKPSLVIPSDEEILNYTDDSVIRKQPELDSVSPENGRDLLQILARTLGIFPQTKVKPQETSLKETPKHYKEKKKDDTVDEKNGMQVIVMNNSAETNEYSMGIDVINVPKSINDELKNAACEIDSNVVFEDDGEKTPSYLGDGLSSENKEQLDNQESSSSTAKPGDISIPKEVYEFLEDYDTISPSASKTTDHSGQVTPEMDANSHANFASSGLGVKAREVVDVHFNFCSKESPMKQQSNSHTLSLSNAHYFNSKVNVNTSQNIEYQIPTNSAVLGEERQKQGIQTDLSNNKVLPLYAIPVGIVSENDQTSNDTENQSNSSTFLSYVQASQINNTPTVHPIKESNVLISAVENMCPVSAPQAPNTSKSDHNSKSDIKFSLPKIAETVPDAEQLWSRILEEYKADRLQNEYNEQNKKTVKDPLFLTSEQQKVGTAHGTKDNSSSIVSKPALARSCSTSATPTQSYTSNPTHNCCDTSENVSFMTCSFSPTNSSNSLKMIFRKEKSPQKENAHMEENPNEWTSSSQNMQLREEFGEKTVPRSVPNSSLCSAEVVEENSEEEGDGTLPYVIVDTGVEICRKAMGTEEHDEHTEDISDEEDWALEKDSESHEAVT